MTSLRSSQGLDLVLAQKASVFAEGDTVNVMGAQYESSLFSSSLSELFSRKCKPSSLLVLLDISFLFIGARACVPTSRYVSYYKLL